MHDPPHSCLCLFLASGFWRFLWLDLVDINVYATFYQNIHIVEDIPSYFPIFASALPRSVKIGIWQAHWLDLVGINPCAKKYQSIHKVSRVMEFSLTVTFWPRHCLSQGKVAFGNSFIWILSILMHIQNLIKISHMVEDLRRFPYFHIFLLRRCLGQRKVAFGKRIG